jgi:hypothetical protein
MAKATDFAAVVFCSPMSLSSRATAGIGQSATFAFFRPMLFAEMLRARVRVEWFQCSGEPGTCFCGSCGPDQI